MANCHNVIAYKLGRQPPYYTMTSLLSTFSSFNIISLGVFFVTSFICLEHETSVPVPNLSFRPNDNSNGYGACNLSGSSLGRYSCAILINFQGNNDGLCRCNGHGGVGKPFAATTSCPDDAPQQDSGSMPEILSPNCEAKQCCGSDVSHGAVVSNCCGAWRRDN